MKNIIVSVLLVFLASTPNFVSAQSPEPIAGQDYIEIPSGRPLDPVEGMIVVEEFFNYICPACNSFEPQFSSWVAQLPKSVKLVHVPAAFRPDFVPYARAYYAAQVFDIVDETHGEVYAAIHQSDLLPAEGDRPDEEKVSEFYADFGVDSQAFLNAMRSFQVNFNINRATDHMRRSRVSSTPSIVINGRYLVRGSTFSDTLRIASYLIEKESQL